VMKPFPTSLMAKMLKARQRASPISKSLRSEVWSISLIQ
jgi:hypothetical protein